MGDDGGTHTYEVMRDGSSMQSGIAYGTTELLTTLRRRTPTSSTPVAIGTAADFSETTGATGTDNDNSPNTPDAPIVTDRSVAEPGVDQLEYGSRRTESTSASTVQR